MSKVILFQGDSITDAGRAKDQCWYGGYGYAALVEASLGYDKPNKYVFYNRGIGGNKILDVYSRSREDIINLRPDFMSMLIGVNDIWRKIAYDTGTDAKRFEQVYRMMIQDIKEEIPDIQIMLMGPYICHGNCTDDIAEKPNRFAQFSEGVAEMAEIAKQIAEEMDCYYFPLQEAFNEAEEKNGIGFCTIDGVHPTPMGHELIKRLWLKAFHEFTGE